VQRDVERLNALISKNVSKKAALSSANAAVAADARKQLEDLQMQLYQLEHEVQESMIEKDAAATRMIELEEQALQWEKKLQLWRETQEAIDPSEGAAEMAALQHDIRNLQVTQERLVREQEQLIQEMERTVEFRAPLMTKTTAQRKVTGETGKFQARRMLEDLAKRARQLHTENAQLSDAMISMQAEIQSLRSQATESDAESARFDRRIAALHAEVDAQASQKQRLANDVHRL
jgi:chromosome segregation ATPase